MNVWTLSRENIYTAIAYNHSFVLLKSRIRLINKMIKKCCHCNTLAEASVRSKASLARASCQSGCCPRSTSCQSRCCPTLSSRPTPLKTYKWISEHWNGAEWEHDLGHLEGLLVLKEVRVPLDLAARVRNHRGKPFALRIKHWRILRLLTNETPYYLMARLSIICLAHWSQLRQGCFKGRLPVS